MCWSNKSIKSKLAKSCNATVTGINEIIRLNVDVHLWHIAISKTKIPSKPSHASILWNVVTTKVFYFPHQLFPNHLTRVIWADTILKRRIDMTFWDECCLKWYSELLSGPYVTQKRSEIIHRRFGLIQKKKRFKVAHQILKIYVKAEHNMCLSLLGWLYQVTVRLLKLVNEPVTGINETIRVDMDRLVLLVNWHIVFSKTKIQLNPCIHKEMQSSCMWLCPYDFFFLPRLCSTRNKKY